MLVEAKQQREVTKPVVEAAIRVLDFYYGLNSEIQRQLDERTRERDEAQRSRHGLMEGYTRLCNYLNEVGNTIEAFEGGNQTDRSTYGAKVAAILNERDALLAERARMVEAVKSVIAAADASPDDWRGPNWNPDAHIEITLAHRELVALQAALGGGKEQP